MTDHQPPAITDLHLRFLLDASPVGMLVFNEREELVRANPPAERLFGLVPHHPTGERCGDAIRCGNRLTTEKGCGHAAACPHCPLFHGLRATIAGTATPDDQEGEIQLDREPGCAPLWIRYKIRPLVIDGKRGCILTVDDISALHQSQERYAMLFREMRNAFALHEMLCDDQGRPVNYRFLAVNPAFERMTGLRADHIIGQTVLDVFPEAEPFWIETYGHIALTGQSVHFEHYSREIGKYFAINAFCPTPGQFACLFEDVTERKAMELQLKEREERLDLAIRGGDLGVWDWHVPSGTLVINQRWVEMLGYTTDEMDLHIDYWRTLVHPDDLGRVSAALDRHLAGESDGYETEHRLRHKSGEWIWVLDKGRVIERDDQGFPLRACGTHLDITRQKILIEQSRDGIVILDSQGKVREANHGFASMLGYTPEEMQQLHVWDWDTLWTREQLLAAITHIDAAGDFFETRHRRKDGAVFPVEISSNGAMCASEKLVFCVCRDITERKTAEEALKEQELFLRSITRSARDAILVMDSNGCIAFWNPAAETIFGYTEKEAVGSDLHQLLASQCYHQAFAAVFPLFQQTGEGYAIGKTLELDAQHKSGRQFPIELSLSTFHTIRGWHTVGVVRDITERKRAEQQIRQSRDFLQTLLNAIPVRVFWKDLDLRYLGCNLAFAQDAGYNSPEELIGKDDFALAWHDQAPWRQSIDRDVIAHDLTKTLFEEQQISPLGEQMHLLTSKLPLKNLAGTTIGVLGVYADITDRKKAEEVVLRNERRLRKLVDILQHPAEQVQEFHDHALELAIELTGSAVGFLLQYHEERRECVLCSWSRLAMTSCAMTNPQNTFHLEQAGIWGEAIRHRQPVVVNDFQADHPLKRGLPGGHIELRTFMAIPIVKDNRVFGVVGLGNKATAYDENDILQVSLLMDSVCNITERRRMEEERSRLQAQLVHAQKMEAIGTLAGGIAHDFNNILGAVIGYAEMAREDSPNGSTISRDLDRVLEAGNRAASLVRQILAFSRQQESERVPLDPGLIVGEVVKLLRPSLPSTIAIRHRIANKRQVLADPTQVHQILMNLATNAFHAMEQTGGSLEIAIEDIDYSEADLVLYPDMEPGPFVRLSVADTGPGIPPEIRARIFDPYFTTKEVGKGTGMGLAIVDGIVRSSGGFITCENESATGTVFTISLPACSAEAAGTDEEAKPLTGGCGHLLLVDDEEILVELGRTMLERLGYEVTTRTSSLEALIAFQNDPNRFDAVITDQTMPGMTGLDLARRMLRIRPDLPIILCTGYSNLVNEAKAKAWGIRGFAMKPLAKKKVAALLKEVLND